MELKYGILLILGAIIAAVVLVLAVFFKVKATKGTGTKIANAERLLNNPLYKKQLTKYYVLRSVLVISLVVSILATFILLSRPYHIKKIKEQKYNRDIIICLDISSSVDELNMKLVKNLQDIVKNLSGERVGIVIFNTSSVMISPLSNDYEYTIKQLEDIRTAIKAVSTRSSADGHDYFYWYEYIYEGTLIGNEERGSSLIGDGLLAGLFAFPQKKSDRTEVIIFATDNDKNGEGYVSLMEAAEYCKRNDVTVYGIGTEKMYAKNREEMSDAVKLTGGKFFIEENASSFHSIVEEIESKSASLVEGKTIIKLIETPEVYFAILVVSFLIFAAVSIILRRGNTVWYLGTAAGVVLLVLVFIFAVRPAHLYSSGPDLTMKKDSNLNVLFVVDDTISMLADDMKDGTRLDKAKEDIKYIVNKLEGAKFSVISFNNEAKLMVPFTTSTEHVENCVDSIYPLGELYAKGTTLDTPKSILMELTKSISETKDAKLAVFYLSDGEITKADVTQESFAEIAQYLDGGAVMGYGTEAGGIMTIENYYTGEESVVMDYSVYPTSPAISRIDEKNLKAMAQDMGVSYVNMSTPGVLDLEVEKLKTYIKTQKPEKVETGEEVLAEPKYYGFIFLIPFAILMMFNAWYVIKRK